MTFTAPWIALLAAAVAVPLLVLLYVLKLRRRRLRMSSTLLWRRTFEDLQVNVPFQRLRFGPLFLLQLVALGLLLLALADPVLEPEGPPASRVLLLIDRSASMNARDGDDPEGPTRLEAAKEMAREYVDRLSRRSASSAVMVIAFGARAQLVSGFESRREVLLELIDGIQPTDEEGNLAAALQLAGNFAASGEADAPDTPDVVLFSDGGVVPPEDPAGHALRAGRFRYVAVGPDSEEDEPVRNVGIVALSARRDYQDPSQVLVFARLVNAGAPVETLVTLLVDGEPGPMERVDLPAAAGDANAPGAPGEGTVSFAIEQSGGAVLSVRHRARDGLAADDTAAVVLPPPARPRIALVHGGAGPDPYLRDLLTEFEPRALRPMTLEAYEALDPVEVDLGRPFDLVVFDGVAPSRLPGIPTVTFGAAPPGATVEPPAREGAARILSWRRHHPLMRHVSLDTIVYAGPGAFDPPRGSTTLATGPQGPVMAVLPAQGAQHVTVGFALTRSNWATHVSVTVFLQNVLDLLTLSRSGQSSITVRPGEPVSVRPRTDAGRITIVGPGDTTIGTVDVPETAGALVTLPVLRRAGLYVVDGAQPPFDRLAVSVLSGVESDLRPRRSLVVNAEPVAAGVVAEAAPRGAWPWFAGAALALVVLEWLVYCRLLRME